MTSVSYDHDGNFTANYKNYAQSKTTVAKNTMPNISNFESAYISPTKQEMISLTFYQLLDLKGIISEIFISSRYAKQNNLLPSINYLNQPALRLRDRTKITIV